MLYRNEASTAFKTATLDELLAFRSWIKMEVTDRFGLPVTKDIGEVTIWDEWWCIHDGKLYMYLHKDAATLPQPSKSFILNSFFSESYFIKEGPYTSKCGNYVAVISNDYGNRKFDIYKTEKQVKD